MKSYKTKAQLLAELAELRRRLCILEVKVAEDQLIMRQREKLDTIEARIGNVESLLHDIAKGLEAAGVMTSFHAESRSPTSLKGLSTLTAREQEVFRQLRLGLRVSTIARSLHISRSTVRNHLQSIFRKAQVRSQAELLERLTSGT
jgi:DNA-binding NarL/FixJ family response regulator